MTYYMHVLPGRIKIRTSVLQRNEEGAFSVSKCLNSILGVIQVKISTSTGSILVHYERHTVSSQTILSKLAQDGFVAEIDWSKFSLRTGRFGLKSKLLDSSRKFRRWSL